MCDLDNRTSAAEANADGSAAKIGAARCPRGQRGARRGVREAREAGARRRQRRGGRRAGRSARGGRQRRGDDHEQEGDGLADDPDRIARHRIAEDEDAAGDAADR